MKTSRIGKILLTGRVPMADATGEGTGANQLSSAKPETSLANALPL
ncbi:hypothetical protein RGQ15_18945 [Paracoccus sp. MBLB3053]|uniref:Single-stranded DNA-binding protein n=1 Tax=Paracoccus aurantius TaxID=3073814 RepID=A0ABU2HX70_9RHOB|nr:hypothetical protein [Paracoccus sp. MBLB3053]MDS9469648.1 hypothetical protein [Paracoccus sp. MBLB3053]